MSEIVDRRAGRQPRQDRTSRFGQQAVSLDLADISSRRPPPPPPPPASAEPPPPPPVPFRHLTEGFQRPLLDPAEVAGIDVLTENLATWPWAPVEWEWGSNEPLPDGTTLQVIPAFGLVVIVAEGGTGKGMLAAAYMGAGSTGRPYPLMPETAWREPGDYIVIAPEDDRTSALVPRLLSVGADTRRVHDLTMFNGAKIKFPSGLPVLKAVISHLTSPRMRAAGVNLRGVIIDPITAAADEPLTSDGRARRVLEPLAAIGNQYRFPVIVTHHTNWDGGIQGAAAIRNIPRMLWYMERDPLDDKVVVLSLTGSKNKGKSNIAPRNQALRFVIEEAVPGQPVTARAVFMDRDYATKRVTGPEYERALAYWNENAYVITDVQAGGAQPDARPDAGPAVLPASRPAELPGAAPGGPVAAIEAPVSPLDRAARALCTRITAETRPGTDPGAAWDLASELDRTQYRKMAAAVLGAR